MKNELTDQIMNDIEKDKLIAFRKDEIMFNAVKKYVLFYLYQGIAEEGKPFVGNKNYALQLDWDRNGGIQDGGGRTVAFTNKTNEELGADLRALARGINIIESGFKEILDIPEKVVAEASIEPNVAL